MFNIGAGEILVVLVVAFVIVGPDDLPTIARWLGRQLRRLRTIIREIKAETGWNELEKEVRDIQKDVRQTARELDISSELKSVAKDVKSEIEGASQDAKSDLSEIGRDLKKDLEETDGAVRAAAKGTGDIADDADPE